MAYYGEIFSYLIEEADERRANTKPLDSKAKVALRAWDDLPKKRTITSLEEHEHFNTLLVESKNVAGAASTEHIKRAAKKGRIVHRTIGWFPWIELINHDPLENSNNSSPHNEVHATILTEAGKLLIANSVPVFGRHYPQDTREQLAISMRRTSGFTEITPDSYSLSVYFHLANLADFVVANSLQVPPEKHRSV